MSIRPAQLNDIFKIRLNKEEEMNTNKSIIRIDPRVRLSLSWTFVVLLMIYADIVSLMDPTSMIRERMVGAPMSAEFLLAGAAVMAISIAPVVLSWVLNYKVNRWVSSIVGAFMIQQIIAGGHGLFYGLFETLEVASILLIIWFTWKWKPAVKSE
jgi:Family of unknown function (DUF6326)